MNETGTRLREIQPIGPAVRRPEPMVDGCRDSAHRLRWHGGRTSNSATIRSLRIELEQALRGAKLALAQTHAMGIAFETARADEIHRLAIVAHELRNPLVPMRNAAAILKCGRPEDSPRVQQIFERQITNMSRMIDDLIDLSRTRTGKLALKLEQVSLTSIVEQAGDACAPALARRGQRLCISPNSQDFDLMADPVRLLQILSNLLGNASKYSPDGKDIRLEIKPFERSVAVAVSDDGIGIAADALPHVFEPFMQEARAVSFDRTGLGVGLAVVRELVEAHGGTVAVSSAGIGCGACFLVTLPRRS